MSKNTGFPQIQQMFVEGTVEQILEFEDIKTADNVSEHLHRMVSSIEAALLIANASGQIEITNQRLCNLLAVSSDALENRQMSDIFVSPEGEDLNGRLREAVEASANPWSGVLQAQDGAGGTVRLVANFSIIQPSANHISVLVLLSPVARARDAAAVREAAASQEAVGAQVRAMIDDTSGRLTAGHLEMIGLDDVRTSLGDRWERLAERVYDVADSILKSRLSKEDAFRRNSDGNFIICFSQLGAEQAWFKAKALGQEIREALIGEDAQDHLAEFKLDRETRERLSAVKTETYDIEISDDELDDIPDVMGLIKKKVDDAASALRKEGGSLLAALTEKCGIRFLGVRSLSGKPMPVQVVEFDDATLARAERLRNIYSDAPKLLAQLDCLLLGTAIERLYHVDAKQLPLTVVEVHFTTLNNVESAQQYLELCSGIIGKPAESLIFKVCNVPHDLPHGKIADVVRLLRNFSRLPSIQLTRVAPDNLDFAAGHLSLVTFEFEDLNVMLKRGKAASASLFERLRQSKIRVAIDHVPDYEALRSLKAVAPDYYTMQPHRGGV